MGKEAVQAPTFESNVRMEAKRTIFELNQFRRSLINDYGNSRTKENNPLREHNENLLENAKENLRFTKEKVLPIVRKYFRLTGRRFDLGHPSVSFFGASAVFYDPEFDSLAYAFAPERKPVVLSDDILNRLYNAGINRTAVETFGAFSRVYLIDEVILAIKHPILKGVKDSLQRVTIDI